MRTVIALAVIMVACGMATAQGDPDIPCTGTCTFCLCTSDVGCCGDCGGAECGCTWSSTFTVPCTSTYKFVTKAICSGQSNCANCSVCADIYLASDPNTSLYECHNHLCGGGSCSETCNACLYANTNYVMRVCLVPCNPPNHSCTQCGNDCKAYGCLYQNVTYECVPLN